MTAHGVGVRQTGHGWNLLARLFYYVVMLAVLWVVGFLAHHFLNSRERARLIEWDNVVQESVREWDPWNFGRVFWKNTRSTGLYQLHWRFNPGIQSVDRESAPHEPGNFFVCWAESMPDDLRRHSSCWGISVSNDPSQKWLAFIDDLGNRIASHGHYSWYVMLLNIPFAYLATIIHFFREGLIPGFASVVALFLGNLPFAVCGVYGSEKQEAPSGLIGCLCVFIAPWIGSCFMFVLAEVMYASLLVLGKSVAGVQTLTGVAMCGLIIQLFFEERQHAAAEYITTQLKTWFERQSANSTTK